MFGFGKPSPQGSEPSPWWQLWQTNQEWQDQLAKRASHKALDIPEDMNITANKSGIGAVGAVGIALAAALGPALGIVSYAHWNKQPASAPAVPAVQAYDAVTLEQQPDGTWKEINRERLK